MGTVAIFVHDQEECSGNLHRFLLKEGFKVKEFHLYKGEMPQNIHAYSALILMGGPMSVKDEGQYPFLKMEKLFVENWLKSDRPLLGICLGAQLIADVMGARVYKGPIAEIGWYEISLTPQGEEDLLFSSLCSKTRVFQWHEDTFDLPEGAVLLACSPTYPQAYRVGKKVYGIQFHIEVTAKMVKKWIRESQLSSDSKQKILEQLSSSVRQLQLYCRKFVSLFVSLCL